MSKNNFNNEFRLLSLAFNSMTHFAQSNHERSARDFAAVSGSQNEILRYERTRTVESNLLVDEIAERSKMRNLTGLAIVPVDDSIAQF